MRNTQTATVTIGSGASESGAIPLNGVTSLAVFLPALDSGTCRLQGSYDGSAWFDMQDTTPSTLAYGTTPGNFVMDGDYTARFLACRFVRVKTSVNQTAPRTIYYNTGHL